MDLLIAFALIVLLFAVLGSGLWIGLSLLAVAVIAMEVFTQRPVGDSMMITIWGSTSSWTLTALPQFLWMGEILFRSKLSDDMFKGLAPWLDRLPGRLLHTNVVGCTIFEQALGHDEEMWFVAGGDRGQRECGQNDREQQERPDARRSTGQSLDEAAANHHAHGEQAERRDQPDAIWVAARTDHRV